MRTNHVFRIMLALVALAFALSSLACAKGDKPGAAPATAEKATAPAAPTIEKAPEAAPAAAPAAVEDKPAATEEAKPAEEAAKEEVVPEVKKTEGHPVVVIETNMGDIVVELYEDKAPLSVANFLGYVDDKFFDGTIFHRVIDDFMVQGGGFTQDFGKKDTKEPIKNEAANGLKNLKYTIAMARTAVVDSATAQFFINVADNAFLDHRSPDPRGFGYAVFGKVIEGEEVVDKIKAVATGAGGPFPTDVPQSEMLIKSVRRR